jgi:hypothetical protein
VWALADSPGFVIRVLKVIHEKSSPLAALLIAGEAVIWLSGTASPGMLLWMAAAALCAGFLQGTA